MLLPPALVARPPAAVTPGPAEAADPLPRCLSLTVSRFCSPAACTSFADNSRLASASTCGNGPGAAWLLLSAGRGDGGSGAARPEAVADAAAAVGASTCGDGPGAAWLLFSAAHGFEGSCAAGLVAVAAAAAAVGTGVVVSGAAGPGPTVARFRSCRYPTRPQIQTEKP